jgi:parallel beta-helix repeat protein
MRTSIRTALIATVALTSFVLAAPVAAHPDQQHVVRPGQSIQAALDAARPGDTVTVRAGVYRENLEITKDHITLRGRGARLEPPVTSTPRRCSENFGFPDNPYGICVSGVLDPETGEIPTPVRGVTVEGFTIGTFAGSGIITFGTDGTVIQHNDVAGGQGASGYSILMLRATDSRVLRNRAHGADGAGIYLGSSPDAQALIAHNVAFDNGYFGLMIRDSVGGTIEHNLAYGNCQGIGFVDGLSPGTAASWTASRNVLLRNNNVCPDEPDISGVGLLLAGAHDITVTHNVIVENVPGAAEAEVGGGVVLTSGALYGGTELPTGNMVISNVVLRNSPADLNLVEVGPANQFTANRCGSSSPVGHC